jgi:hypothetical protein
MDELFYGTFAATGVISGVSLIVLGFLPNFLCAGICGCGWINGCCNCYVAGLVFVAAMSFAYEIPITEKCKDKFELDFDNTKDSSLIYQEVDGTCYYYNKDFTVYLSWVYYIGISALGLLLIALAIFGYKQNCMSEEEPRKPEGQPMVAQGEIENGNKAFKF